MFTTKQSFFQQNLNLSIKGTTESPCLEPYNYFVHKFQTKDWKRCWIITINLKKKPVQWQIKESAEIWTCAVENVHLAHFIVIDEANVLTFKLQLRVLWLLTKSAPISLSFSGVYFSQFIFHSLLAEKKRIRNKLLSLYCYVLVRTIQGQHEESIHK